MTDTPSDTDEYIYRPVTRMILGDAGEGVPVVESVVTQIWITQP